MKSNIILFENEELKLKVNIKNETVWLNRKQISIFLIEILRQLASI